MRLLILLLCLSRTLASVVWPTDAKWGEPVPGDRMLGYVIIEQEAKNGKQVTQVFNYYQTNQRISRIYVYDNLPDNSGALPRIVSGGIGHKEVIIFFRSRISGSINSKVEIYSV